jgi:hypothetical protein
LRFFFTASVGDLGNGLCSEISELKFAKGDSSRSAIVLKSVIKRRS